MTKQLIPSSILLSSLLLTTGCVQESQPIISNTSPISVSPIKEEVHLEPSSPEIDPPYQPVLSEIHHMKSVQGQTISIQEHRRGFVFPQYKEKIVLIQIFGKDCPYCFEEMPVINRIQNAYRDKLSVIAIQGQSPMSKETAFQLISEHNMNYPIIDQDEAKNILVFLRDVYEWRGILPYILLIKNGLIEQVFEGADNPFEKISKGIDAIK
jgi:thiol-disulfide isomerase/thioredoxin